MTTVEFFHRIGRRARTGDFTKLNLSERTDLANTANAAIQIVYNALPTYFKELTEGFLLPAPRVVSAPVTADSASLGSDVFTNAEIGRTVILDGDQNWNQVLAPNRLQMPYLGATGTVAGTVYGDAVYSERYPFDRILADPKFASNGFAPIFPVVFNRTNEQPWWPFGLNTVGLPQAWWTQLMGNSQGNEPLLVLKFAPLPDRDYAIKVRMSYCPKRLTMADYNAATVIPVPDQFIESALIPIAYRELMSTPIWASMKDEERVERRAQEAIQYCRDQLGQVAAPSNRIGTPIGY